MEEVEVEIPLAMMEAWRIARDERLLLTGDVVDALAVVDYCYHEPSDDATIAAAVVVVVVEEAAAAVELQVLLQERLPLICP